MYRWCPVERRDEVAVAGRFAIGRRRLGRRGVPDASQRKIGAATWCRDRLRPEVRWPVGRTCWADPDSADDPPFSSPRPRVRRLEVMRAT